MPLYEYHCPSCNANFTALNNMSVSHLPASCQSCGELSRRVLSAPHLTLVGTAQKRAHERNEKSAHEPSLVRRSSCGCSGRHVCQATAASSVTRQSSGSVLQRQTKATARPWMLGH
ncbi:MAG: zinc ribbon domain-containing protein [Methylococcaceae bacterium]|nr:MAG: zinc ribbon domain-containing protein [Methylococcaceae bacterium]